ncbi:MAG: TIGR04282 family arsenosugar biosynthesis glycosyltransferase [Syntrophobacter sp.]
MKKALLVFMRYPRPGRAKTRLAREIGPERAAATYEKLLRRTLGIVSDFHMRNPDVDAVLFHTPDDPVEQLEDRFRGPWRFSPQEGAHLGERMKNAFAAAFSLGAEKVVLIGSDTADMELRDLDDAFRTIDDGVAVLGPALDGGFYLIGLNRLCGPPFHSEAWGTADIFSRTARELASAGFRVELVAERADVDRPGDLPLLEDDSVLASSLSVIIPTMGSPERLKPLLDHLENQLWPGDEIILVQSCLSGETTVSRRSPGVVHARCPKGRGLQQDFGAKLAEGTLFFFLHDDTVPPPGFPYLIRRACGREDFALGCFSLAFSGDNRLVGLIADWANARSSVFKLPYGDQGLFCRRDTFERVGGFQHKYLLEDVALVRQCRSLGKLTMLPERVYTSPERYLNRGILRASMYNQMIMLLFLLGVDERELYSLYYR